MADQTGDTPVVTGTPEVKEPVVTPPAADSKPAEPVADTKLVADPAPVVKDEPPATGTDWAALREGFAKGDEKLAKRLARYSSVDSALEALVAAQDKIAKGEHKTPLGADATPEEIAAFRAANGIPEKPEDYKIELADNLVVGEADKPLVDAFLKEIAHPGNMPPGEANKVLSWYFAQQEAAAEERTQLDFNAKEQGEEALREEWGSEFKLNKNLIIGMLDSAPDGVGDSILSARTADGTPLASHPATLRWLADMAREINPVATVVPGSGTNAAQTIETELAGLTKMMGDKNSEYWKGPLADKNQERYRQLIEVQQKLNK